MRQIDQQTILITGSTDGLGKHVARELASKQATVLIHGRDEGRCRSTLEEIASTTGSDHLRWYAADLSSLEAVNRLATALEHDNVRLDALINNAGIGGGKPGDGRKLSVDGHELVFAVNYLAHFLLTHRLLGLLRKSAPARVVNVASVGQAPIDFDNLMLERDYEPFRAYCQSKLAQIMFTFELSERLGGSEITVNSLHPASLMDTKMVHEMFGAGRTQIEDGAGPTLRLVQDPELDGVTGVYFDRYVEGRANDQAYDRDARTALWNISEQLTGLVS